ncbi:TPA: MaoC family dehydratase N-terminal domain-containing protein [Klebsiella michiganensis]|nr:MaoC family dehydratase N-terminal domain-containing protein [Klebsiella michiganensis]
MFIDKYFEDFSLSECRTTTGRTITESDIVIHAGQTGDFYPHHMDAEWCKTQPFGQRIAHGTLTFAIAVGMTAGVINSKAMTYGYEKLRFPHPVFIGDTLRVNISISEKRDHPRNAKYGFVTEKLEVVNQRDECVMATQHVLLVEKRDFAD